MTRHFGGSPHRGPDRARVIIGASAVALMVLSALLFFLVFSSGSQPTPPPSTVVIKDEPDIKMVDVLVSVQDVEPGTPLEPTMFRREPRPQIAVDNRVVRDFEEIKSHFSRSLIVKGQPLLRDLITTVRPANQITASIPSGFRAVTISVDARSSVEGWARPGARVDIMWASRIRGQPGVTVIVQNAQVLSAERNTDMKVQPGMPVPSTATLLVSADDAAKIQLATTTGQLSLNLRGDSDSGRSVKGGSITVDDLLGNSNGETAARSSEGKVRMRGPDGKLQDFVFREGKLVPADG